MTLELNVTRISVEAGVPQKRQMFTPGFHKRMLMLSAILTLSFSALSGAVYTQSKDDLDFSRVMKEVKERFNLSSGDVKSISPLLSRENRGVVAIYARFSEGEPEYSNRVWQEVIARRCEFLSRPPTDLTKRQWAALRAARSRVEERIVDYLVEDYFDFLAQYLELGKWELMDVQDLFESDKSKKLRLLDLANIHDVSALRKQVENISEETESKLQKLLTEEQRRSYRSLTESLIPTA